MEPSRLGLFAVGPHAVEVAVEQPTAIAESLRAMLAAFPLVDGHASPRRLTVRGLAGAWTLSADWATVTSRPLTRAELCEWVAWCLNQLMIASADERTTLHAAAVHRDGFAVMLPAPMESGKSTTCLGMIRRGWQYLTDEAAHIDVAGRVHPYPKALTIDPGSQPLFPELAGACDAPGDKWQVPVAAVGEIGGPAPVGLVLFPRYSHGVETVALPLTPGRALLQMAESTFRFPENAAYHLSVLGGVARFAPAYDLQIGSLDAALDTIEALAQGLR